MDDFYDDDDYRDCFSLDQQERDWKRRNADDFKAEKWTKMDGRNLSAQDAGKRIKFLWHIPWENDTYDVDGIITAVHPSSEPYYHVVEVIGGTEDNQRYHGLNVYGCTVYIQQ